MDIEKIRVLPDGVANQIAAGEVVGRPASVVKELLENAVDAGSTSVTVNFKEGGRALIQVVDNGCGMNEPDARMAFERHADLENRFGRGSLTPAFVRFSRRGASVDRFGGRGGVAYAYRFGGSGHAGDHQRRRIRRSRNPYKLPSGRNSWLKIFSSMFRPGVVFSRNRPSRRVT